MTLKSRLSALEKHAGSEAVWLVLNPDETTEQGIARWEARHGACLPDQRTVAWCPIVTGVSRTPDSQVRV